MGLEPFLGDLGHIDSVNPLIQIVQRSDELNGGPARGCGENRRFEKSLAPQEVCRGILNNNFPLYNSLRAEGKRPYTELRP